MPTHGAARLLYAGDTRRASDIGRLFRAFGKIIGMGYVKPEHAEVGTKLKVKMFDQLWDAEVVEDSPMIPRTPTSEWMAKAADFDAKSGAENGAFSGHRRRGGARNLRQIPTVFCARKRLPHCPASQPSFPFCSAA